MSPTYDPKQDYISAHLQFANKYRNFQPKGLLLPQNNYLEVLTEQYKLEHFYGDTPEKVFQHKNKLAFQCYQMDLDWINQCKEIHNSFTVKKTGPQISFVTIGFNHQEFTPEKGVNFIKHLLNLSIIGKGSFAVLELHRENGEHPHVHIKVFHEYEIKKSTIVQTIFRCKDAKKLILKKNFIDVKPFQPFHEDYLSGAKCEDKMPYVEKDKEWRVKHKIADKIEK